MIDALTFPMTWLFDVPARGRAMPELDVSRTRANHRKLVCAACRAPITVDEARIEVNGGHEHAFFNPAGIVFQIGCFGRAPGCRELGPASPEFSWFSGYTWRIACCGQCRSHLGWSYQHGASTAFFGLILNRLLAVQDDAP